MWVVDSRGCFEEGGVGGETVEGCHGGGKDVYPVGEELEVVGF